MRLETEDMFKNLNIKICKGIATGKLNFMPDVTIEFLDKSLKMAIDLEEYEAASVIQNKIKDLVN